MSLLRSLLILTISSLFAGCTTYGDRVEGRLAASEPGKFSAETLTYASYGDLRVEGDLFLPARGKNFPLVIMIHGGGWVRGNRQQMTAVAERFVLQGYAVFNISYRFAPQHHWPAQREDVEAALAYMQKHAVKYSLDLGRVAAFGYSAGAHLALMLAYHSDRARDDAVKIQVVGAGGAPVDLTAWPESELVVKLIGHPYSTHSHLYREASPLAYVNKSSPPTVLYHGTHDWIVEVEQSKLLYDKLKSLGVTTELYEPFFGHVNTFLFDAKEIDLVIKFFQHHLEG